MTSDRYRRLVGVGSADHVGRIERSIDERDEHASGGEYDRVVDARRYRDQRRSVDVLDALGHVVLRYDEELNLAVGKEEELLRRIVVMVAEPLWPGLSDLDHVDALEPGLPGQVVLVDRPAVVCADLCEWKNLN